MLGNEPTRIPCSEVADLPTKLYARRLVTYGWKVLPPGLHSHVNGASY